MRGVSEVEIGGVQRGFKFGTYSMALTSEAEGIDLIELNRRLEKPSAHLKTLLGFLHAAAVSYCISKGQKADFTTADVADWLDEIGLDKGMDLIRVGLAVPNTPAPEAPGQ